MYDVVFANPDTHPMREKAHGTRIGLARVALACAVALLGTSACHAARLERGQIIIQYREGQESLALKTMEELQAGLLVYGR